MTYQFDPILGQGRDGAVSLAEQQKGFDAGSPAAKAAFQSSVSGYLASPPALVKSNRSAPAFSVSSGALVVVQAITVIVPGGIKRFDANAAITAVSYTAGTDYVVTCDGTALAIEAYRAGSDVVGGFHYSLANGINPYSIWDINFRPSAINPRGMALVAGSFWADIYLTGANWLASGSTSIAGASIATGTAPPKVPMEFGGNGTTAYGAMTWFDAGDVLSSVGKRRPSIAEFASLAYGVTEGTSVGVDPATTNSDPARRSKWGIEQATGNKWVYAEPLSIASNTAWSWDTSAGRGAVYLQSWTSGLLGGYFSSGVYAGSRCAYWAASPVASSSSNTAMRGVCAHYQA